MLRQEDSWHGPNTLPGAGGGVQLTEPNSEQAGVAVAYDVKSGAYKSIYSMGRSNHENELAVSGYGHPVVFTGDDTFDAPSSQLYMLSAKSGSDFWNDDGTLYVFVSDLATDQRLRRPDDGSAVGDGSLARGAGGDREGQDQRARGHVG